MSLLPRKNLRELAFDRELNYCWNKFSLIPSRIAFALGATSSVYKVLKSETLRWNIRQVISNMAIVGFMLLLFFWIGCAYTLIAIGVLDPIWK